MSLLTELKQVIYEFPLTADIKARRKKIAHFCEHNGICTEFTPARSTWQALAPLAIRPWWLKLNTIRSTKATRNNTNNKKNATTEVLDNA